MEIEFNYVLTDRIDWSAEYPDYAERMAAIAAAVKMHLNYMRTLSRGKK